MALRRYHCYGCDRQFGTMVNLNGSNDIKCSQCGSEFVEEMKSVRENPIQNQNVELPQQSQQAPRAPVQRPISPQVQSRPMTAPVQQQQQRRTVTTQRFGGSGQPNGYTQSVTISYGTGMNEPQVQTFTSHIGGPSVNIGNMNNINMNFNQESGAGRDLFEGLFSSRMPMFFMQGDEEQTQSRGVSEEYIDNLPPMDAGKEADCNICLEKVGSNGNKSCQLPCGHAFDKSCLSTWLKDHDNCPCCRTKLDQDRVQQDNDEQQQPQQQRMPQGFHPFQSFFNF